MSLDLDRETGGKRSLWSATLAVTDKTHMDLSSGVNRALCVASYRHRGLWLRLSTLPAVTLCFIVLSLTFASGGLTQSSARKQQTTKRRHRQSCITSDNHGVPLITGVPPLPHSYVVYSVGVECTLADHLQLKLRSRSACTRTMPIIV